MVNNISGGGELLQIGLGTHGRVQKKIAGMGQNWKSSEISSAFPSI